MTISFASWAVYAEDEENLDTLMIDAFMEEYPHITVEIDRTIDPSDWNGSLSSAASGGTIPDVFLLSQVPIGLANDWLLNLNDLTGNDEDFAHVPDLVHEAVTYNETIYALPSAQHFLGYFVNKDIFNQANLDIPEYGYSLEQFGDAVRQTTDLNSGIAGLNHPFSIIDWYPTVEDESVGWFTFNESDGSYRLNSNEFINGINLASNLLTNGYAYEALDEEQQANFNGDNPEEVWMQGGISLKWDGTWGVNHMSESLDFEWDFIGIPGGRTVVVNDYMGLASSTEHPEEAYLFAKWMSFGKEGFLKRIEIAEAENRLINSLPVTTDQEVLDAFYETMDVPGVQKAYEQLDQAIIEPVKTVPGFAESRWNAPTGVSIGDIPNATISELLDASIRGDIKVEDYAAQLNDLANQKYEESKDALELD